MSKDNDAFGPLPKKPVAAFHHPTGLELYDALAMDLHALRPIRNAQIAALHAAPLLG